MTTPLNKILNTWTYFFYYLMLVYQATNFKFMWGDGMYNFIDIYIALSNERSYRAISFTKFNTYINNGIKRVKIFINGFCSLFIYIKYIERRNLCIRINSCLTT